MTDAPPSRWAVLGRGLAILLAWHVVLAGVSVALLDWLNGGDEADCVEMGCHPTDDPRVALALTVVFIGIPASVSLLVSAASCGTLVLRSDYPPALAATVGALAGLVAACFGGLLMLGLPG